MKPVTSFAKGTFFSLVLTSCAAFTACTYEVENISQQNRAALQLSVGVNQPTSRAIVEGKTLPNTAQIGVSVVDNTGTAYQNQNYNNVLYTAAEVEGKQTWSTTANVTLSGEEATLYAYYPYAEGADITAIPVDMTETDQKDWMYATPATGLSDGKATAEVQLNHALTDLRLTFYKDTYSGEGEVTEFTIQSTGMAVGGTLNAKTGEITLPATPVNTITRTADFTLTDKASATPIDVMLIPTGTEAPVNVSVTVDGHTYSASTTAFTLQKAKAYNYVMKLTSTGLEVTSVALTDWNEENLGDAIFEPEDGTQGPDYSDWVKLTYKVEDAFETVKFIHYYYNEDFLAGETYVDESGVSLDMIDKMVIEGVGEITPAHEYTFASTGEHNVYVKFKEMTVVPEEAFFNCSGLTSVTIPNSVQTIGNLAFWGCTGLTSVTIPNSVTSIGTQAFYRCEGLTSVTIPNSVTTIGVNAFAHCDGLTEITIPNSVTEIGGSAFMYCSGLTEITIPNSVQTIGDNAFNGCEGLTSVTIPNSVTTIGVNAFVGCSGLETIVVDGENTVYDSRNNCNAIMETATNKLIYGCNNTVIPNDCEIIGENAFAQCDGLTEITIPNSVTEIGGSAFTYCSGLTEITIPNSVTSIGEYAFGTCSGLTTITSLATTAPSIVWNTFNNIKSGGTLYVPTGATGYDTWMATGIYYLGQYNWTIQEITE